MSDARPSVLRVRRGCSALLLASAIGLVGAPVTGEPARGGRAISLGAPHPPAAAPAVLSPIFRAAIPGIVLPGAVLSRGGDLLVATAEGDVVAISPAGRVGPFATVEESLGHGPVAFGKGRFAITGTKTPLLTQKGDAAALVPLPLTAGRFVPAASGGALVPPVSDGGDGLWFVRGARFLHLSGGRTLADGSLPRPVTGLAPLGSMGALAFDGEGSLFQLAASARAPLSLGSSHNAVEAVPLEGSRVAVACNDGAVVLVDLDTRKIETPTLPKHQSSLIARPGHGAAYLDASGNLVLLDATGSVSATAALTARAAELVALSNGEIGAALAGGDLVIVEAGGNVRATGKGCDAPLSLTADKGRLLLVCRDGRVVAVGDEPKSP